MNPTIWLMVFVVLLAIEFVSMSLMSACFAAGAVVAAVMGFAGLPIWAQIMAFVAVSAFMLVVIRPVAAKTLNRHKRQQKFDMLIGRDAVVICEIDNAHRVGVVNVGGKELSARSNRPNAIISEGAVVKIISMRGDVAIVDDMKRKYQIRDFDDDYLD